MPLKRGLQRHTSHWMVATTLLAILAVAWVCMCMSSGVMAEVPAHQQQPQFRQESPSSEPVDRPGDRSYAQRSHGSNSSNEKLALEQQTNNLRAVFAFVFTVVSTIVTTIVQVILFVLSPVFFIVRVFYHVFIYAPYTVIHHIVSTFYPLYMFCAVAALLGCCVGGTAGWISEVIVGVLTAPAVVNGGHRSHYNRHHLSGYATDSGASSIGGEGDYSSDDRNRLSKVQRRAAALANLRARYGDRLPEEFRERFANAQAEVSARKERERHIDYGGVGDYRSDYSDVGSGYNSSSDRYAPMYSNTAEMHPSSTSRFVQPQTAAEFQ